MEFTKISTWMAVSQEAIDDAPYTQAHVDLLFSGERERPLALRERITGWRYFTANNDITITIRVGWRATVYDVLHPLAWYRRTHPRYEENEP